MKTTTTDPNPKTRQHGMFGKGAQFGLTERVYLALGRFAIAAEQAGIKSTAVAKTRDGYCCLKLTGACGSDYEVIVNGSAGSVMLGQIDRDGKRTRLAEASPNTQAGWDQLLAALKNSEQTK
jgi:hypothetical protein